MPLDRHNSDVSPMDTITLLVPGMTCAGCMIRVEDRLKAEAGVVSARVNLSAHNVFLRIDPSKTDVDRLTAALANAGYDAREFDPAVHTNLQSDTVGRDLLLRLGIAGFAAMNVMLLSISVWSGADAATRDLLHWVSGLIALPAIAYAGQPFFKSAVTSLRSRRLNMDVPITLAVLLSAAHSVLETARSAQHAYFDAGIMLVFFLLIGRYLDHRTRQVARSAASELLAMTGRTALRVMPDGTRAKVALNDVQRGMIIEVAAGEYIPADGTIAKGTTDIDRALVTGESHPESATSGDMVHAGMLNLSGAIQVRVTATGDATLLAEIAHLVDAAERGRGKYDRIADRAARIYAPLVHVLAAAAFVGWILISNDAHLAVQVAIAVLIVTCPCALALAVPTVHTAATAKLFKRGIFLKDGAELERLADIDMVVFDKTGTLTEGVPHLSDGPPEYDPAWPVAAALARQSRHPFSQAIAAEADRLAIATADVEAPREHPGIGIEGKFMGQTVLLGHDPDTDSTVSSTTLTLANRKVAFRFSETLRPGTAATCEALRKKGLQVALLSGDKQTAVDLIARRAGIEIAIGDLRPDDKLAWLEARRGEGRKILMVGDGLNDTPALASAHASISPASAMDAAKTAAGFIFTGTSLAAVSTAHDVALSSKRRTLQSFGATAVYNAVVVPLAMMGLVTPLFAALAMSASSILVMLNAVRPGRTS